MRSRARQAVAIFGLSTAMCLSNGAQARTFPSPRSGKPLERSCPQIVIEGAVHRGESYRRSLGGGLDFLLEAVPHGWVIRVIPSTGPRPSVDLVEVATPPFRSMNQRLLTTDFNFRAQDVVGWNPRRFGYVETGPTYASAVKAYAAVLASAKPTMEEEMAVAGVAAGANEGRLEILDATLTPGTADQFRSAATVATHYETTAHVVVAGRPEPGDPLVGRLESLRFRVTFRAPGANPCSTTRAGSTSSQKRSQSNIPGSGDRR